MKKILLFFMALFVCANSAWAESYVDTSASGLITSADQITSPYTQSDEGSIAEMIDGNSNTYWHSSWSGGNVAAGLHYFQVDIDQELSGFGFQFTRRNANDDQITSWGIYGVPADKANATKDECTLIATISTPFSSKTETLTSSVINNSQKFTTFRFYAEATTTGRGYFHIAEFQIYPIKTASCITWNVIFNDKTVATETIRDVVSGTTYTTTLSYPFITLGGNTSITATTEDQTIDLTATTTAPLSTETNPKYYYIANSDKSAYIRDEGDDSYIPWISTKHNTKGYKFALIGDPFNGVKVKSKLGNYLYSSKVLCPETNSWYSEPIENTFVKTSSSNSSTFTITDAGSTGIENGFGLRMVESWWSKMVYAGNFTSSNLSYSSYWNSSEAPSEKNQVLTFEVADAEDNFLVTYNYQIDGETVLIEEYDLASGSEYPTPAIPSTTHAGSDYYNLSATPEGTITEDVTKTITVTQNLPFKVSSNVDEATWYTMTIGTNKYYISYTEGQENISLSTTSTTYNDADLFCFVGNVVTGFTIYNKEAGLDKVLSANNDPYDGNTGGSTYVTLMDKGTANKCQAWDFQKSNDIENGLYIAMHNIAANIRMNNRGSKLAFWNFGADTGSTFLITEITDELFKDKIAEIKAIPAFTITEGATVICPTEYKNDYSMTYQNIADAYTYFQSYDVEGKTVAELREALNSDNAKYLNNLKALNTLYGAPLSVDYTIKANRYGTIILPVNWTIPENWEVYTCSATEENGTTLTLNKVSGTSKNTPYIIKTSNENAETFQFIGYSNGAKKTENVTIGYLCGVLNLEEDTKAVEGSYVLQTLDGVQGFYKVGEGKSITIPVNKCYLTVTSTSTSTDANSVKAIYFPGEGTVTSIEEVFGGEENNGPVFDLQGRRVNNAAHGIYIINGKKVLK